MVFVFVSCCKMNVNVSINHAELQAVENDLDFKDKYFSYRLYKKTKN